MRLTQTNAALNAPHSGRMAGAGWGPLPAAGGNARLARCRSLTTEPAWAGCSRIASAGRSGAAGPPERRPGGMPLPIATPDGGSHRGTIGDFLNCHTGCHQGPYSTCI